MIKEKIYLGTYTKRKSKGIYSVELNKKTEKLENLQLVSELESPTYIAIEENKLFAVTNKDNKGGIAFIEDGNVEQIFAEENATPCYIDIIDKNYIVTANYHTAEISIYKNAKNELKLIERITHTKDNVEKTHAHFVGLSPDKKYIIVCYLGSDEVITYSLKNDKLIKNNIYKSNVGAGPRHLIFNNYGNIAYLICELDATVEVLNYNSENGTFTCKQKISILENENQKKWAAAIKITKDNKFLYTSNRGDDLITCFKILDNANIEKIQTINTYGEVARDFTLDSEEQFLIVGHQESDSLTLFKRNNDGRLKLISSEFFAPEVVCLKGEK